MMISVLYLTNTLGRNFNSASTCISPLCHIIIHTTRAIKPVFVPKPSWCMLNKFHFHSLWCYQTLAPTHDLLHLRHKMWSMSLFIMCQTRKWRYCVSTNQTSVSCSQKITCYHTMRVNLVLNNSHTLTNIWSFPQRYII